MGKPCFFVRLHQLITHKIEMDSKNDKIFFYILLLLSFIAVVYIYLSADSSYDTGDGYTHYLISRYSWKHPYLLVNLWGKPLFTLVSSPFAQLGLKGMYVFQALNAAITSLFLFKISSKLKLKYTWIIPVFIFFAPVYFAVMNSGLVEIFFGTIFIFSVWLVFNKHFYSSAIVVSFIPFVRPEAYVVIPLFIALYIYRRRFYALPMLLTGTIFYSIAGYTHYKDILWIITQNYKLIGDNYVGHKGSYFHYFRLYGEIWGTAYTILIVLGIGTILFHIYRFFRRKPNNEYIVEVFLLFLGSTIGFFALHSILCGMPGILNNLGILRYLAVLIPGSAILALIGLNIITLIKSNLARYIRPIIVVAILFLIVRSAFSQWYYPFRQYNEGIVMKQMGKYLQTSWPNFKKICFAHPSVPLVANVDPFDSKKVEMLWSRDLELIKHLPDSSLLLWDSHYMQGECNTPLNLLASNPDFVLLKHYRFTNAELPFEVCLFLKVDSAKASLDSIPIELISANGLINQTREMDSIAFTFENDPIGFKQWVSSRALFADKYALGFKSETEYGPSFSKLMRNISSHDHVSSVKVNFDIFQADTSMNLVVVVEIKENSKTKNWQGLVNKQSLKPNRWNSIELQHLYTGEIWEKDALVNIYFWNKGKQQFYVDKFKVTFGIEKTD